MLLSSLISQASHLNQHFISDTQKQNMYQMMQNITTLLDKEQIQYFVTHGTLLGAIRHQDVIPWDDDIDIGINANDEVKVQLLEPQLDKLGYTIKSFPSGLSIRDTATKAYIEIIPYTSIDDKIMLHRLSTRKRLHNAFFLQKDLYPLKKFKFGPLFVYGPNHPETFLSQYYGKDFRTVGRIKINNKLIEEKL